MNNDMALRTTIVPGDGETNATRPLALSELAAERSQPLPRDLPRRPGDTIAISARSRELATRGQNSHMDPLSFWDHDANTAPIGERNLAIDASGSYRLD